MKACQHIYGGQNDIPLYEINLCERTQVWSPRKSPSSHKRVVRAPLNDLNPKTPCLKLKCARCLSLIFIFLNPPQHTMEQNMRSRKKQNRNSLCISGKKWEDGRSCSEVTFTALQGAKYNERPKEQGQRPFPCTALELMYFVLGVFYCILLLLGHRKSLQNLFCYLLCFMESEVGLSSKDKRFFVDFKSLRSSYYVLTLC